MSYSTLRWIEQGESATITDAILGFRIRNAAARFARKALRRRGTVATTRRRAAARLTLRSVLAGPRRAGKARRDASRAGALQVPTGEALGVRAIVMLDRSDLV